MEKEFEPILDKDETIIKVYKPNKFKLYASSFVGSLFMFGWIAFPLLGANIGGNFLGALGLTLAIFFVLFLAVYGFTKLYYNKLFYAYSNKRIIIRTGIFGVDFKSLDMSMIGAVNVNVSLLDKLLKRNTGSITFGSMASPMVSGNGAATAYRFSNIELPYESYREMKDVIDAYKATKQNRL